MGDLLPDRRPDRLADHPVARVVEDKKVVDAIRTQPAHARQHLVNFQRLKRESVELLEDDVSRRILSEIADDAAVERDKRQGRIGDRIPLASEGADDVQRKPQRVQHNGAAKIIEALQAASDRIWNDDAAFKLVHRGTVEVGDDGARSGEIGLRQKRPELFVDLLPKRHSRPPSSVAAFRPSSGLSHRDRRHGARPP
ncbi:MAG: hypothetical protein FD148_2006 [Methylocystaceae bacterium]|nr:MAG: hypothetical protein FD148_2006 [Methylocystaceae bacterium]